METIFQSTVKEQGPNHNLWGWTKITLIKILKSKIQMFGMKIKDSLIISLTMLITRMMIVYQMRNKKWEGLKGRETWWQESSLSAEYSNLWWGTFTNREEIRMILMNILLGLREGRKCSLTRSQVLLLSKNDLTSSGKMISYLLINSIKTVWRRKT